jgi:hypothetical protein
MGIVFCYIYYNARITLAISIMYYYIEISKMLRQFLFISWIYTGPPMFKFPNSEKIYNWNLFVFLSCQPRA